MQHRSRLDRLLLGLGLLSWVLAGSALAQVTVTHVANEGFLLEGGGRKVLVDALFDGIGGYRKAVGEVRSKLESARPPFDGVVLAVATHYHDDHFSPGPVLRFLKANPKAHFLSTPQAVAKLRVGKDPALSGRVSSAYPAEGRIESRTIESVRIDVLNLHHGRGRQPLVENLGYVVHLGGRAILHVGDTQANFDEFSAFDWTKIQVDLALFPVWYLTGWDRSTSDWPKIVRDLIRPKHIGAMHLASEDAPANYFGSDRNLEGQVASILRGFPGAVVFTKPLQKATF